MHFEYNFMNKRTTCHNFKSLNGENWNLVNETVFHWVRSSLFIRSCRLEKRYSLADDSFIISAKQLQKGEKASFPPRPGDKLVQQGH